MRFGIMSDTHDDPYKATPHVINQFKLREVDAIVHCGDIEAQDMDAVLYGNLPVICVLNPEQVEKPKFQICPQGWQIVKPDMRVIDYEGIRIYAGHRRAFRFITEPERSIMEFLGNLRRDYDGLRWVFAGHTHQQFYVRTALAGLVNPGAVCESRNGHEFAVVDTENGEVIFSRIPVAQACGETFSVGIISETLKISLMDNHFWTRLADEFRKRDVKTIIHCGNIELCDIGRPELADFDVHVNLRDNQKFPDDDLPSNWHITDREKKVVEVNGFRFFIQFDLGASFLSLTEVEMHNLCLEIEKDYPALDYVLCGSEQNALFVEDAHISIINSGDAYRGRCYCVLCLPRQEVTFGYVPVDPLPALSL